VIVADGQCTAGSRVLKPNVKKLRRLGEDGVVIVGFAGWCLSLFFSK
jgi:ATP-dependent HslUV protease subunit HslV